MSFFSPAQQLMAKLRYTGKFLLVSAVFGVPLLYLAFDVLHHQYTALQAARELQDNVSRLQTLTHITADAEQVRNLSLAPLADAAVRSQPLYQDKLQRLQQQLDSLQQSSPARLPLIDALQADVKRGYVSLSSEGFRLEQVFESAHRMVQQLYAWRYEEANRSGLLARAPEGMAQSASILFNTLPGLLRSTGRAQAFGDYFLLRRQVDSSSAYLIDLAWQHLETDIRQLEIMARERRGYDRQLLENLIRESRAIQNLFDEHLIQVVELSMPWVEFHLLVEQHQLRIQALSEQTFRDIAAELQQDYRQRQVFLGAYLCGILLIGLMAAYLFAGFYMAVRSAVTGLRDAAQRVAGGDFSTEVAIETRDEMAQLAKALDKMRLQLQKREDLLRDLSLRDGLTGLRNRPYFDDGLVSLLDAAARQGTGLALLLVDLDHFKRINDSYGHPAGDEVLRRTAEHFRNVFKRKTDILARYGGEEFAIVLPDIELEAARQLAEQLRACVAAEPVMYGDQRIAVTCSIGLAWLKPSGHYSDSALINAADMALYRAKHDGRNQVSIHSFGQTAAPTS